jgi:tRNA dimethylallyltransferase
LIGITLPPEVVGRRIAERYQRQLANGFLDEVRRLRASPVGLSRTASQALGYKELAEHLRGERTLDDAVETAVLRTRRFARRQRAWFRRDPRIEWLSASSDPDELLSPLTQIVSGAGPVTGTLGGTCG